MNFELIIIISISLITFLLSLKNLKWGFYFFMATILLMHKELFSLVQWDFLPSRFASIGIGLALLIRGIIIVRKKGFNNTFNQLVHFTRNDRPFILLIILLVIRLISSVIGENISTNYNLLLFYSSAIILYLVASYIQKKEGSSDFFKKVLWIYMGLGVIATIFAFVQMYLKIEYDLKIGAIWPVENNLPRLGSTFWDVNHFGGFLITVIPLYFIYTFIASKWKYRFLNIIALGMTSSMLFFTQSRSSWLGISIAMVVGLLLLVKRGLYKPLLLFIGGCLVLGGIFITYLDFKDLTVSQKIKDFMHYRLDSTDTHLMLVQGAVQIFYDKPIIGSGSGNFNSAFRKTDISEKYFEREPNLKNQEVPPHSIWGEVLAESGYLGFMTYLILMVFLCLSLVYIIFKTTDRKEKLLGVGFFISLVAILITGIFYSFNLEFFWILFILATLFIKNAIKVDWSFRNIFGWFAASDKAPLIAILPLALVFILVNIGGVTLLEWDEAIYAKVAKNIVQSGDWLNLRWDRTNDYWFEKPPLYMWLSAATFTLTGINEFSARIWSAILGISTVVLVYFFGKKLYNKFTGLIAAIILLNTAHFLYYARNSLLDVPVSFFILATVAAFYWGTTVKNRSYLFYILAGVTLGLGVMTKAIVGLIPLPIIILYLISTKVFLKEKLNLKGILITFFISLLVFMPWHVYSYIAHGNDFIETYLFKHIFDRGTEGLGHVRPLWWYFEVLMVSYRIWLAPLIGGLIILPFVDRSRKSNLLVFTASIFIFIFFSIPKDKLSWYLVPIYPFIALLSARFIDQLVIYFRSIVKESYLPSLFNMKLIVAGLFIFLTPFYISRIRDKVYFEDVNRDIVELIKIHNQIYPINEYPELDLYYARIPHTVALFYSDHMPIAVSTEKILNMLDDAKPDRFYTFLMSQTRFYQVRGELKNEVSIPVDLRVRGSSGNSVLVRSMSEVDLLKEGLIETANSIGALYAQEKLMGLTEFEVQKLNSLEIDYQNIVNKLNEYGYPPEALIKIQ